jgi:SAM-dependent methyltransferase
MESTSNQLCAPEKASGRFGALLDIGAGDGSVTEQLAPFATKVFVTEESSAMRWRLWSRGFTVIDAEAGLRQEAFDCITMMNVLDRCDCPITLLQSVRSALKPSGVFVLAVVMPWCPFVERGTKKIPPRELLPMQGGECCKGATFEASTQRLVENVLTPLGFTLERWTKLPYLSQGSVDSEYYVLHDAVFLLRKTSAGP